MREQAREEANEGGGAIIRHEHKHQLYTDAHLDQFAAHHAPMTGIHQSAPTGRS